jgi:hypothetical protein
LGAAAAAADGSGVAAVRSSAAADDRCVADVRASAAADDDDGRGAAAAKGRGGGQHDEFECNGTRKIESDTPICRSSFFYDIFLESSPIYGTWLCFNPKLRGIFSNLGKHGSAATHCNSSKFPEL